MRIVNWEIGKMYGYQWTHWEKFTETDTPGLYEKSYGSRIPVVRIGKYAKHTLKE